MVRVYGRLRSPQHSMLHAITFQHFYVLIRKSGTLKVDVLEKIEKEDSMEIGEDGLDENGERWLQIALINK